MRPVYETAADRERAKAVIRSLGWGGVETAPLARHDWSDVDIRGVRVQVEVKVRGRQYDTYMLSKRKLDALMLLPKPLLVVAWQREQQVGAVALRGVTYTVGRGGRADRGDALDVEDCAFIAIDKFRMVAHDSSLWWVLDYIKGEYESEPRREADGDRGDDDPRWRVRGGPREGVAAG